MKFSIGNEGVQATLDYQETRHLPDPCFHEPGSPLWDFFQEIVKKRFERVKELEGMELVRVDLGLAEAQFSWISKSKLL